MHGKTVLLKISSRFVFLALVVWIRPWYAEGRLSRFVHCRDGSSARHQQSAAVESKEQSWFHESLMFVVSTAMKSVGWTYIAIVYTASDRAVGCDTNSTYDRSP